MEEACRGAARILSASRHDLPFVLIYLLDEGGSNVRLVGASGLMDGRPVAPAWISAPSNAWASTLSCMATHLTEDDP